ncbi:MAG TPA: OmpA family protein [Pseudonocardia sp.]|nr:OmpA family protein [Pseudonocardia sp.]
MRGPVADRTTDRSRRPALLPLVGAGLVVPTVLAGLTQVWPRPQIEAQLMQTGGAALTAAGFPGAGLIVDGRDATISGIDPAEGQRAVQAVEAVPGVRIATVADDAAGGPAAGPTPAPAPAPFGIARRGEDLVLSGVVGSPEERTRLLAAANLRAAGRTVVDELTVTPGAALPTGVSPTSVEAAPANAAAAALPGLPLDNRLVLNPASAAAPPTAPAPPVPAELDAAGKQQLASSISQLLAGAPITFRPNSPQLTGPGRATVTRLVELVGAVPAARLQVDGFVATGPGNGRLTAQQLSDQRAAVVRDALVAAGVPAGNIVARGLGEGSKPAARAAGRRVDITVI